ncbi:hypothetical protein JZ751_029016 [Albula glossodonta]|uniref:Uncharacterized protein n=1 Tax=Albula glossodonta TaxID=121402 RepID=A0A8T2P8X0_9TELE|nr:hypothetical protein JZ751_029016 [Albula glossodonta]
MTNDDMLQKIKYYMGHSNVKLQLAATFCVSNLIWNEEDGEGDAMTGSQERQDKLREMGFVDILHKLTQASDPNLCDRPRGAERNRGLVVGEDKKLGPQEDLEDGNLETRRLF